MPVRQALLAPPAPTLACKSHSSPQLNPHLHCCPVPLTHAPNCPRHLLELMKLDVPLSNGHVGLNAAHCLIHKRLQLGQGFNVHHSARSGRIALSDIVVTSQMCASKHTERLLPAPHEANDLKEPHHSGVQLEVGEAGLDLGECIQANGACTGGGGIGAGTRCRAADRSMGRRTQHPCACTHACRGRLAGAQWCTTCSSSEFSQVAPHTCKQERGV